jgi:hypothetical protein
MCLYDDIRGLRSLSYGWEHIHKAKKSWRIMNWSKESARQKGKYDGQNARNKAG